MRKSYTIKNQGKITIITELQEGASARYCYIPAVLHNKHGCACLQSFTAPDYKFTRICFIGFDTAAERTNFEVCRQNLDLPYLLTALYDNTLIADVDFPLEDLQIEK